MWLTIERIKQNLILVSCKNIHFYVFTNFFCKCFAICAWSSENWISVNKENIDLTKDLGPAFKEETITIPDGVEVYEIDGPFFFGIANRFEELMITLKDRPQVRIFRMRKVPFIDSTGIQNLTTLCQTSHKQHITVVLSGVNKEVYHTLEVAGFNEFLGKENICPHIYDALKRSKEVLADKEKVTAQS